MVVQTPTKTEDLASLKKGDTFVNKDGSTGAVAFDYKTGKPLADPSTPPITSTTSAKTPKAPRAIYADEPTLITAKSEDQIQKEKLSMAQGEISSLNEYYNSLVSESKVLGEKNMRSTDSISVLTGLAGSSEARVAATATGKANQADIKKIENERNVAIQAVLGRVKASAVEEAKQMRLEARQSEQDRITYREKAKSEAVANLTALSKSESGATLEGLKATLSPEEYTHLIENSGGEAMAKAILFENRPKNSVLGTPQLIGGKMVQAYTKPDGGIKYENIDLPDGVIPDNIQSIQKTDAGIFIIKKDGTWSKVTGSAKPTVADSGSVGVPGTVSGVITRDAESVMSGTLNLQDISVKDNYRAKVAAELKKKGEEALKSGDVYGTMKASAIYDKEPSDTFLQSMEKTVSVLDQLGVLQENIAGVNTGPIVGTFKNKNPWDTKAQTIKAQLNAIVPNLARGVYGEVGVLTDNDIKTYSKTIPNLTATEDIRNAIMYITIDMIRRNIETKIKNQAAGQRDMSGYADIYNQVKATASEILAKLPGSSAPGGGTTTNEPSGDPEYDAYLKSIGQ